MGDPAKAVERQGALSWRYGCSADRRPCARFACSYVYSAEGDGYLRSEVPVELKSIRMGLQDNDTNDVRIVRFSIGGQGRHIRFSGRWLDCVLRRPIQGGFVNVQVSRWRRRYLSVGIAVVAMLLAGQLVSVAAEYSDQHVQNVETVATKAIVGIPQTDLERLRKEADKNGRAERPAKPQAAERLREKKVKKIPAIPLVESARQSRLTAARNLSMVNSVAAAPIGSQPDATLLRECFDAGPVGEFGRVHNRFTHCVRSSIEAEYWSLNSQGVPIKKEGTTKAILEVFTQGDDKERRARSFARVQKDSVSYDWGIFDNLFVAPNVPLSIMNQCRENDDVCHASGGAVTMPWIVWDNSDTWFFWDVHNHENSGQKRDKLSYNGWYVEYFTDFPPYKTFKRGKTEDRKLRYDSADYFFFGTTRYPKACVFSEVTSRLNYQLASEYRSVALHIFEAQMRPNDTYPLLVPPGVPRPRDKRIPGRFEPNNSDAPGLHRITPKLHPGEVKGNEEHKNGACYKEGPFAAEYLETGLPVRPETPAEQCDEYPFASTLEGAYSPLWDFSVKAVPQRDNSVAGGLLNTYYVNDRVLAWDHDLPEVVNDRFYVNIQ